MIEKLRFGRTGHMSTRAIFGGAALWEVTQPEADRTLELLLANGVNHIDTAPSYGVSEDRVGPWMAQHRSSFFLATKTLERTYQKARDELHRSLERLQVDAVDLLQLHYLVDPQEWEIALGPGGALEAAVEARTEGLVRFIGVTGHGLTTATMHLRSLQHFDFDSVLLPYNYVLMQNAAYAASFEALVQLCEQRDVAVQTIKGLARGPWGQKPHIRTTWYETVEGQGDIDLAVHWVLGRPGVFLNTTGDQHLLPMILDAANRFRGRPSDQEMEAMTARQAITPLFV